MSDPREEDLKKITEYANTKDPEEIADELKAADAFAQLAWLDFGVRKLEDQLRTMFAVAYADYKGELIDVTITLPEGENDSK